MELKINEVCRSKGMLLKTVAEELGISRQALHARIVKNPKWSSLVEIAKILGVHVLELIEAPDGYSHVYNGDEWNGIKKE